MPTAIPILNENIRNENAYTFTHRWFIANGMNSIWIHSFHKVFTSVSPFGFASFHPLKIVAFNVGDKNSKNVPSSITNGKNGTMETWFDTITICTLFVNNFQILFTRKRRKESCRLFFHSMYTHFLAFICGRNKTYTHDDDDKIIFLYAIIFYVKTIFEYNQIWFIVEEEEEKNNESWTYRWPWGARTMPCESMEILRSNRTKHNSYAIGMFI